MSKSKGLVSAHIPNINPYHDTTLFSRFLLLYKVDINVSCIMCPNGRLVCLIDDQMVYKVMGVGCAIERELQW